MPASASSRLSDETRSSFLGPSPPQSSFAHSPCLVFRRDSTAYDASCPATHAIEPKALSNPARHALGFGPHRDFTRPQLRFTRRRSQLDASSVLRFSQPLDGLLRNPARRPVSSCCHVQGSARSRASLSAPATPPHRREHAPVLFLHARSPGLRPRPRHTNGSFEAFIRAEPRSFGPGYSPNPTPLPSSSFSPAGPPFSPSSPASPAISALDIFAKLLRFRARF